MARPRKEGMEYFPHDTDASSDEKIDAMRALFGNNGYAFYFLLCERIYRTNVAELDISKPVFRKPLVNKLMVTEEEFSEMLDAAFELGLFCPLEFEARGVITSSGIKKRFSEVNKMRGKWRKDKGKNDDGEVFSTENPVENPVDNATENAIKESKVKESKEKDSKEKEIKDYTQNAGANQIRPRFKFNGPLNVLDALNHYQVETKSFHHLENIESYQNVLSDDLILYAIELADKRTVHYSLQCLADWNAKGYKTLADHPEHKKTERGNANEKHGQHRGRSEPPAIDVTQGRVGWIKYNKQTAGSP